MVGVGCVCVVGDADRYGGSGDVCTRRFERWEGCVLKRWLGVWFKVLVRWRRRGRLSMVWGSLGQATGGYPSFERVKASVFGGRASCAEVVLRAGASAGGRAL